MIWLMITHLLGLLYFAANPAKIVNRKRFRLAWMLFSVLPMVTGFFTFLRSFTVGFARHMAVLEIISNSLSWLLLGVSLLILLGAILPSEKKSGAPRG
jgi:hypothetical protein